MKRYITLFILLTVLFISGCNSKDEAEQPTRTNDNTNQFMNVKNSPHDDYRLENSQKISQHLANLAGSVPNVERATAVTIGNFAIVGIDVNEDLDRSKVGSIKYAVSEALNKDSMGADAVVVADPDIMARLGEINEDIKNGRPVQGILNELSDIMGRIMPEIPGDLQEPDVEQQMEEPKQETDQKNARELDKLQNEQSNDEKEKKQE